MRLFDGGKAPNPRRVRVFLAEKGISVPLVPIDLGAMEHKGEAITAINPMQTLPILELDDGTILTESVAICRYFEALHPEPNLFGKGALEQALVEMWNRRLELSLHHAVMHAFRHLHPAMKEWEVPQVPQWGEANRAKAVRFLEILEPQLAGSEFIAGDSFTIADITGMIALDFMKPARIMVPDELVNVRRWHAALRARPSASA